MSAAPFITAPAAPLLALIAFVDFRQRRIPNAFVLALIGLAAARIGFGGDLQNAIRDLGSAALVFVGVVLLWRSNWLGGGDAKFIFAGALLVGAKAVPTFLLATCLCGGVLGLVAITDYLLASKLGVLAGMFGRTPKATQSTPLLKGPVTVPYGIAISFGCLWALLPIFTTLAR
jgi:Flp pilus assembly protein protease CpaA